MGLMSGTSLDGIDSAVVEIQANGAACDLDGQLASRGRVDRELLADLLSDPYYRMPAPKSTGKEHFHGGYLDEHVRAYAARRGHEPGLPNLPDLLATLCALTAETVADQLIPHGVEHLLVSGGGTRNPVLMAMLAERLPATRLIASDDYGVPSDAKEAIAFAVLGWHTAHGFEATLPSCTGAAGPRCLGSITPTTRASALSGSSSGMSADASSMRTPTMIRFPTKPTTTA